MKRKYEKFRFMGSGIPEGLEDRLIIPLHIKPKGHLLAPYVNEKLIQPDLDLILLENFNDFYEKLIKNYFRHLSDCWGLYFNKNHMWADKEISERIDSFLKEKYGVEVERALLLPQKRVDYWTIVHEALHDVFNHLKPELRNKIIKSATNSYNSFGKIYRMMEVTHLNIPYFEWDDEERERRYKKNKKVGRNSLYRVNDFYTFGNLKQKGQLQVIDEFISNFYTNDRIKDRFDKKVLVPSFKRTLRRVGYNLYDPPRVVY